MSKLLDILLIVLLVILFNINSFLSGIKPVTAVKTEKIKFADYINVSGEFQNQNKTQIILSYPVCIDKIYIKENQYVNKGQALFSLDKKKMLSLLNGNIESELLNMEDFSSIYGIQNNNLSDLSFESIPDVIYSTDNGYVSDLNIVSGKLRLQNNLLMTIEPENNILAKFTVSQIDFGKIEVGDSVSITPMAFSNKQYNGKITDKHAVVKKQNSITGNKVLIDVFATIECVDNTVSDGLQINGKIQIGNEDTIEVLDYSYINQDENGEYTYILSRGKARKVYILTGTETNNGAQLLTSFPENTLFIKGDIIEGNNVIIVK